jgi:NAD(P)-dependent dehydrogenase (short-subunit alcohol dehydrogenase family)
MTPKPDHGEESYKGCGKLEGRVAIITGGDSGIGRAVAIAFAREGADVLISYLPEEEDDARETARWVEQAGRRVVLVSGDIADQQHCKSIVERVISAFGKLDILVSMPPSNAPTRRLKTSARRSGSALSASTSTPCSTCRRRPCHT